MKRTLEAKRAKTKITIQKKRRRPKLPPSGGSGGPITLQSMSPAMVERLWWRAGFGPSAEDRATWPGRPVLEAVDHLLSAPATLKSAQSQSGTAIHSSRPPTTPTSSCGGSIKWCAPPTRWSNVCASCGTAIRPTRATMSRAPQLLHASSFDLFRKYSDFGTPIPKAELSPDVPRT